MNMFTTCIVAVGTLSGLTLTAAAPAPEAAVAARAAEILTIELFSQPNRQGSSVQFSVENGVCFELSSVNFNDQTRSFIIANGRTGAINRNCTFTVDAGCKGDSQKYSVPKNQFTVVDSLPAKFDKKYSAIVCA